MKRLRDQDGNWAWVVLCGCALCVLVTSGFAALAGIFQTVLLEKYRGGVVLTSWITSLFSSLLQLAGPVASLVSALSSCRVCVMFGGVLLCLGLIGSAFCNTAVSILFTLGIMGGLGSGLIYSPAVVMVNLYFVRYRTLATGSVLGAGGIGIMVWPLLCWHLLEQYSWQEMLIYFAMISAQLIIAGAILFPLDSPTNKRTNRKIVRIWRRRRNSKTEIQNEYLSEQETLLEKGNTDRQPQADKPDKDQGEADETNLDKTLAIEDVEKCSNPNTQTLYQPSDNIDETDELNSFKDLSDLPPQIRDIPEGGCDIVMEITSVTGEVPNNGTDDADAKSYSAPNVPMSLPTNRTVSIETCTKSYQECNVRHSVEHLEHCLQSSDSQTTTPVTTNLVGLSKYLAVLKNPSLFLICFQLVLANAGIGTFLVHFFSFCLERGSDPSQITLAYSINGITMTGSRFLLGFLIHDVTVDPLMVYVGLGFVASMILLLSPIFAVTSGLQITIMSLLGIYSGGSYALLTEITIQCTSVETLGLVFGLEMVSGGLGYLVAPPVAGWLVNYTGSYNSSMLLSGALYFASTCVALAVSLTRSRWTPTLRQ